MKLFSILLLLIGFLMAEPSAFELQSGATKAQIRDLEASSKDLESRAMSYESRIASLEENQDGVRSILESQAIQIRNILSSISGNGDAIASMQTILKTHSDLINDKLSSVDSIRGKLETHERAIEDLSNKVNDLGKLISDMNKSILAQLEQLKNIGSDFSPSPQAKKVDVSSFDKDRSKRAEILKDARSMYSSGDLDGALERFKWLHEINYRSGFVTYMMGEILYKKKQYTGAIDMYKISAGIDDKASYMPILLWHTAWSFRYLNDMSNYDKFINSLVRLYPDSEQAAKAKQLKRKS